MKLEFHKLALLPLFTGIHEEDLSAMLACLGSFQKNYRRDEIILLESNEVRSVGVILALAPVLPALTMALIQKKADGAASEIPL